MTERLTHAYKDQMLTGGLDYFHLTTPESIVPTADREDAAQAPDYYVQARVLERIIDVIRDRSNLVILGVVEAGGFSFAVEHRTAIDVATMQAAIRELGVQPFSVDGLTTVDLSLVELEQQEDFKLAIAVTP